LRNAIKTFVLCFLTVLPTWAATYNPSTDFSASNPSGAWKYGYASSGAVGSLDSLFSPMPTFTANCASGGGFSADCWSASSSIASSNGAFSSGTVQFTADYINLHPGQNLDLSVLAFIAPTAANYTFVGEFADRDVAGGSGVALSTVLGNGTFLVGPNIVGSVFNPVAINFTQNLSQGQAVYFVVGANGEYSYDSVGLKLDVTDDLTTSGNVPEPSTLLLTGLGAAAVLMRRWRR
jgi:hypothetical protein